MSAAEVRRIPPGVSGVYLLHAFAPRLAAYPAFYAGQSNDLRRRLLEHIGHAGAKPIIRAIRSAERTYWSAAPVADDHLRRSVEAGLINLLDPVCNDLRPQAAIVVPNLPPMSLFD